MDSRKIFSLILVVICTKSLSANSFYIPTENYPFQRIAPPVKIQLINSKTKTAISNVKILIKETGFQGVTDNNGEIILPESTLNFLTVVIEDGDYLPVTKEIVNASKATIFLTPNVLQIKEVVVTGIHKSNTGTTSTLIGKRAIEHLQATNLKEVLQLVPGTVIENPTFNNVNQASIRQYGTDNLGSLGTSVIINGAVISNNANLQAINTATAGAGASFSTSSGGGTDLRTISADNIESVEIVRGIPSVEYGDLNSGAIIVKTKAKKEPLQMKIRFNPSLTQFWAGKGFGIKENSIFADFDFTKSNDSETNKYRTYKRASGSIQYTGKLGAKFNTNTYLSFSHSEDKYDLDPDYVVDSVKSSSIENFIRLNTSGILNIGKKLARTLNYSAGYSYGTQKGYQQQYYTADITAESQAVENSTNIVPYLPSSYLSKMWVDGKPSTFNVKVNNQFYFKTGAFFNTILLGAEWKTERNSGDGKTFNRPIRNTSGAAYRTRGYSSIPSLNQLSFYAEDAVSGKYSWSKINANLGLRYDMYQPFNSDYSLSALSPRASVVLTFPLGIAVRGGYGITAKSPTLLYLYPENAYFDFYSLNYYAANPAERLAIISTRVYKSQNNDIKLSKTQKFEAGLDFILGKEKKNKIYLTGYYEQTDNGYSLSTTLNSVKFADYPIFTVSSQVSGQPPKLSSQVTSMRRFVSYYQPTNNINRLNKGLELELDFGRINKINTTFNLSGAYTSTKSVSNNEYILQQNVAGRETTRIGVFASGRGTVDERIITTSRAITNIPELSFIVSLTMQTIWMDKSKYVGYDSLPVGYIPFNQGGGDPHVIYFHEVERQDITPTKDPDIYLSINDGIFRTESWKPLFLFNVKLTKEFRSGLNFSFYANNFLNNRPLQSSTRYPNIYYKRNIPIFFGSEISFKL